MVFPDNENMIKQIMLTSSIIWEHELRKKDIEKWLENFKGELYDITKERQLALWMLLNFVFYNQNEVKYLCKTLFKDFVHSILSQEDFKNTEEIVTGYNQFMEKTLFYDLGRASESGGYVLYYFRQENNLPIKNFISDPNNIPDNIENIVYIDDVTLSEGDDNQARDYLDKDKAEYNFEKLDIYLLTFIATEDAKKGLNKAGYNVISCITLNNDDKCFSKNSNIYYQFPEYREDSKKLAEHYGKKIKKAYPLGWKNGQQLFGFFYNTPNNTLPIFWCENNNWYPILKRYQKKYSGFKNGTNTAFI